MARMSANEIAAASRSIMTEMDAWDDLVDQNATTKLDVYIDLKSPHAYLAVRPSLEVARDFSVQVDFHPFTLSYEGLGLSTSVEPDMQRRPPSAAADRRARMYYAAAREYAYIQGLPFRTPHRLLDSDLAHRFMLFAKTQRLGLKFAMSVYLKGWSTGWRDFELESHDMLLDTFVEVGGETAGLSSYLSGPAVQTLSASMEQAEALGAVGVPHYVYTDPETNQATGLFGREHLALIRGKFAELGLARRENVNSEFSHAWRGSV